MSKHTIERLHCIYVGLTKTEEVLASAVPLLSPVSSIADGFDTGFGAGVGFGAGFGATVGFGAVTGLDAVLPAYRIR